MEKSLKDIIKSEYSKCAQDPVHFMRKYCKIQHPKKGKIYFNLYPFQEKVLHDFRDNDYNIVLKSRQLGISTLCAGYALWLMTFHSDKNILVIATTQNTAKNLVTKVRVMHEFLPSWLKVRCAENNKLSLRYDNGSQIKAVSSAGDSTRSEALSLLIIDEAAFISGIGEIWTSAQQTLATGGKCIALSTPNGIGNWFHQIWEDAETSPKSKFHPIKLHWTVHPERDQAWRDEQTALLGEKEAAQECDCDFITSGGTVIDSSTLQWYDKTHVCEPKERRGFDSEYWTWSYPDYNRSYMVIADVARGDSADYSAFHVFDIESLEQVAEYKGKINTKDYGNMLVAVATEWNNALLVIENSNIGWATIQQVLDRGYENLYYSYKDIQVVDANMQISKGYDLKDKSQMVPGFTTSSKTRPLVISKLDQYMRERAPIIHSKRLINELFVFLWINGRAEAQVGYNDDLVMAFGIGLWVRDTAIRLRQEGIEMTKKTLGMITKSKPVYTNKMQNRKDSGWTHNVRGNDEDLTWLVR